MLTKKQKEITEKYGQYKIKKHKTFNEYCFPKTYTKQFSQKFISEYMNNKNNNRMLIYHKIGSGKTCAGISIAEKWKGKKNIYFIVPASLINNVYSELMSKCTDNSYINDKQRDVLMKNDPSSDKYIDLYTNIVNKINKYYNIYSYHKFVKGLDKINIKNSIFIIDEVHNLISESGTFYKQILNKFSKAKEDTSIILMTATPIYDKPSELGLLFNLFNPVEKLPVGNKFDDIFMNENKTKIKNKDKLIKYFTKLNNISYYEGTPQFTYPKYKIKIVKCNMSNYQYKNYKIVLENEMNKKNDLDSIVSMPNNFFIGTRMISNIAYPNNKIGQKGYDIFKNNYIEDLKKYSVKFDFIIDQIEKTKGTLFIYSNFREHGGIKPLIKVLEYYGYLDYKDNNMGKNRFAVISGDESLIYRGNVKEIFNKIENKDGSKIKIIIGSPSTKEGISFYNTNTVILMEPYWNWSRMFQIIGRAVRYCSHKNLPENKRQVKVYVLQSIGPKNERTVDSYIVKLANDKQKLTESFEKVLQETSVDYHLYNLETIKKNKSK